MKFFQTSRFWQIGFAALLLASCAGPARESAPVARKVWPPPPSEARIEFAGEIRGPRDVGQNPSALRSFANWITGDKMENLSLRKPFAVALDEKGNLCIADTGAKVVCLAEFERKQWMRFAAVGKTKFLSPVAVARRHGIFYVADSELGKIFAFNDDGKSVFEIAAPLVRPTGLVIVGDSLFVADAQAHSVSVFSLDGKFQFQFGRRGAGNGEFNFPTCVTADNHGHVLVTDTLNCRVQVFDARGNYLSQFGSNGDTSGHFARPKGIAVDADGHSYIVDAIFNNFQIFDADGKLLLDVGQGGAGAGEFDLPSGIAIGSDNRIFVADSLNHRVQIFKYLGQP